jgi:ankyrin repeat protein
VRALADANPSLVNRVSDYNSYYIGCGAPLKNAAVGGHIEIVKLLLERGADPNLPEEGIAPHGHALYSAVYHGHFEIAKLLLEHGAYPNPPVESSADAVWIAIRNGDKRMLELLAAHGATWEIPIRLDGTLTYQAIAATGINRSVNVLADYNDLDTAAALFATNPTLADDPEALGNAAGHGHEEFVRLMLRYHPDLAKRVTVSRPRAMALFLFEHGMDPNRPNWLRATPLHHFAEHGDVESAALFIDHGADVHARDEEFCSTPLAWAARCGRTNMVGFLLRRGARSTLADDPPWATPLAWATRRGHGDIVQLLRECETSGTAPARGPDYYDAQARDLVEACGTGEDAAMRRVAAVFGIERPLMWDRPAPAERVARLRRYVRERLGSGTNAQPEPGPLTLVDAQLLIARLHGYEDWSNLVSASQD